MPEPRRAALYYAPEADDPLWQRGCAWLGYNPETGDDIPRPAIAGPETLSDAPRRYGFHATLKPPMALRHGLAPFLAATQAMATHHPAFDLPPFTITNLHGFLALCLTAPCPPMQALADACVIELDGHRVPETAADQARRAKGRPPSQRAHIARWGYPLVLEEFRFHMTLTNRLDDNPLLPPAREYFADACVLPRRVTSLALFVEDTPATPFRLLRRIPLGR